MYVCMYVCIALLVSGCSNAADSSNSSIDNSGGGSIPPIVAPTGNYNKITCSGQVGTVTFAMKSIERVEDGTVGDDSINNNKVHKVNLTAFHIGTTEVTQELWQAVMGENPSRFQGSDKLPAINEAQEKRPVENINWFDCIVFCNELTKMVNGGSDSECVYYLTGEETIVYTKEHAEAEKTPIQKMDKKGFRLPTGAEWEWAAQSGSSHQKYAGTDDATQLDEYAWHTGNADKKTHQVGLKTANAFGLYDMTGNVEEWCWNGFSTSTDSEKDDPTGSLRTDRIRHGGSYRSEDKYYVIAHRPISRPKISTNDRGLRIVCRP
ncbi:SUMF1/EgtB/PvdO family nonheme iron enzyme [Treponema parvum]|uniref:SUMF1/EgtB/PvdO family nonheme iron enzyme n=1 Tax=Treponema parvum TaxID=138851 RepID=A0A975F4K8_9SPIR|nr:SUMF1/EgtB/PvdO family nonheme iron enzyme [Treponema parvum]QTQ14267.1 SUMF1/EgtB/PvdO family nonheme iron enzyme [Treponema parvum]